MFNKILNFVKFNNLFILILAIIFIVGSGVFAQTETGQALIGEKQTTVVGVDNTLLIAADISNLKLDYKVEKIEQDEKYYYVTYTYIDLLTKNNAWGYQIQEKTRKVSKKLKDDLGMYMAKELAEEYEQRIKDLKIEQEKANASGPQQRVEVAEYSGLIGGLLDTAAKVIPNYQPVKKTALASPTVEALRGLTLLGSGDLDGDSVADNLDNCPTDANPDQKDSDANNIGDVCDINLIINEILNTETIDTAENPVTAETTTATSTDSSSTSTSESEILDVGPVESSGSAGSVMPADAAETVPQPEVQVFDQPPATE